MGIPKLPVQLSNNTALAMAIYAQWRINMIRAKVDGADEWPVWADMEADTRIAFLKAVQTEAIDVIGLHYAEVELEQAFPPLDPLPTPPMFPSKPKGPIPCYTCGMIQVDFAGDTCANCDYLISRMSP